MKNFKTIQNKTRSLKQQYRLSVFKSNKHIYAQIINDMTARTLISCSTVDSNLTFTLLSKAECIALVGKTLALRALAKDICKVSFDRGQKKYCGLLKILADNAKQNGLSF